MKKHKKEKTFLKLPTYPGGNAAFRKFIETNLKYPEEAFEHNIEGVVNLEYEVDDMGNVSNVRILHGLGHGCDEEALRLVSIMKYEKVKNRGMRVRSTVKTNITFKIPKIQTQNISYTYIEKEKTPEVKPANSYNYKIKL